MPKQLNEWLDEFVENGADASNVTDWPEEAGGGSPIEEGTGIKITGEDTKTISIDEAVVAKKTDIGNGTITITQGGTTKGSFTLNQKTGTTINLDAGGGSQGELTLYTIHYEKNSTKFTLYGLAYCTNTYGESGDSALTELYMNLGQQEVKEFPLIDITGTSSDEPYLYIPDDDWLAMNIHYNGSNYKWLYDSCSFEAYGWAKQLRVKEFPNLS